MKPVFRNLLFLSVMLAMCALSGCQRAMDGSLARADKALADVAPAYGFVPEGPGRPLGVARADQAEAPAQTTVPDGTPVAAAERKLVRRGDVSLQVPDLAAARKRIGDMVKTLGGYVASESDSENHAMLTLRVPSAAFDGALASLTPIGKVLNRSVSAEDVTMSYYDMETRLKNKKALIDRYRAYLKQAASIKDILETERQLNDLTTETEWLEGQFRHLADLVDFAEVSVSLSLPPALMRETVPTLADRLADVFREFGNFLATAVATLVAVVVYGTPIVVVLAGLFWLLLGRVGLLRKLYRLLAGPRTPTPGR